MHPEIGQVSGRYYLRQVVQGINASDPSGRILWTSVGPGQDATGNTKAQLPHDIATDSQNPLEGTWNTDGVLLPGANFIWLDFDGFDGSVRQFNVLRHHFNGSRIFLSTGETCPPQSFSPTQAPTSTNIPTDGPSPTPTSTITPSPTPSSTLTFTPSVTRDACAFLPTRTPIGGLTPTGGAGGDSIGIRTTPCPATYTPTFTITPSPSSTLTFTPSIIFEPCGLTGSIGGDGVGIRTTPCPVTYTPTFTPSLTPTETPTLTPSVTDLPSLTPEPSHTSEPRQPMQLLVNPGMDNPVPNPVGWQVNHKPATRKDDRMRFDADLGVFMFKGGEGENSKFKQTIRPETLPFQTGDYLNLSLSYRKAGPQPNLRVKVDIVYGDGTPRSIDVVNLTEFVNSYRSLSRSIQLTSPAVNAVIVTFIHKSPNTRSKVFIDSVELWWMPAP